MFSIFDKPKKKKVLKEEEVLIQMIREIHRPTVAEVLSKDATDEEIDQAMDRVIEKFKKRGVLKELLDKYLQQKIQDEREKSLGHPM